MPILVCHDFNCAGNGYQALMNNTDYTMEEVYRVVEELTGEPVPEGTRLQAIKYVVVFLTFSLLSVVRTVQNKLTRRQTTVPGFHSKAPWRTGH
jgi:hypothetical protein